MDVPEELEDTLGEELRDTFEKLCAKMVQGKKEYGDGSLDLPIGELLDEVDAELMDTIGWAVIGRRKLNVLRATVKYLEQRLQELQDHAAPQHYVHMQSGEMVQLSGWQPIETAPKDGTTVLVWYPGGPRVVTHWYDGAWIHALGDEWTHWHPLPEPPVT